MDKIIIALAIITMMVWALALYELSRLFVEGSLICGMI